jgi:Tfp pilus assembly protein PilN
MMLTSPRAGLYLCDERLVVVVVPPGRRGAVQSFVLEAGELPGSRLKTELETRQVKLRRMRIGLARPLLTVKTLELPSARGAQLAEMVAFELERHVPFPPEDMRFDFVPLWAGGNAPLRVLVVACERRTVEGALRLLEEPRLKPAAVTAACHDLPALLGRGKRPRAAIWAHRSATTTDLVCLSAGRLEMSRTVPIKDAAELATELAATLHLVGWGECDAIWISGDDAAELLSAPVLAGLGPQIGEPPLRPSVGAMIQALPEDNRGESILALASAIGSRRPSLNLLPPEARPRTLSTEQVVTASAAVLTAALGLALLAGQGYQQHRYATRLSRAIQALDPEVKSVEALAAEVAQKRRLLDTIQGIERNEVRTLPILRELTERIPPDAWLRTLTMDKQGIEITGQANAANQLIPLLENSPSLTRVEFTAPVTKAGDKEQFRIKAAWKNAPKTPEPAAKTAAPPAQAPRGGAGKSRPAARGGDLR